MPKFGEKSLVEDYFVEELEKRGWGFVVGDSLERESLEETLLMPVLVRALESVNEDIEIGNEEIQAALNELKLRGTGIEGSKYILNYFKFGIPIKFEKERIVKYVQLFDYNNIENNNFIVSRQVIHKSGDKEVRNDIILYANGIPLVNIECKNPASFSEDWHTAYRQIKDYEKTIPELYKYVQVGIGAEQNAKYFTIVPWLDETHTHEWKEPSKDPIDSTIEMLTPNTLLNIIKNYLFFRLEHGSANKVIARYMQYRAAEKIYNRIIKYLKGKTEKNKGLIWHWQGSGKTLTMIFAANKAYQDEDLGNPTIFFIVDREELQEQLNNEFNALDITTPEVIDSIQRLREVIKHDEGRGKRGIHITLIHKFRPEELEQLQKELEKQSETQETLLTRKNVVAFIDEGHRTQYGTLAGQMKLILKNAFFFSFTGTPISIKQRNTYDEFAYPPEENYFDRYFITDSIKDGFTVKIAYQPRLEKEPGIHLNKQMLDTFIQVEFEEIPEQYREKVEEKVKKRIDKIRVVLENEKRINRIAEDIAEHFKDNLDGKFKAMIVAVSRKACVHYKRALDKHLPKEYSEVVMTYTRDDKEPIQSYLRELQQRFKGKEPDDIRKELVEKYKEETLPKILIVTDMLLTGFDAPILQAQYLDKPLKGHRLLQAIARTNRPYKDIKEAGMILDYVGILKEFQKAFKEYSKEDITGILYDMAELRKEFTNLITQTMQMFENIPKDQYDRKTMLQAIEILTTEEENSKAFLQNYKQLRKLFELLGPDEVKIRLYNEYKWLSLVYTFYITWIMGQTPQTQNIYIQKYFQKTLKYVHESTEVAELQKDLPIIEFDDHYMEKLQEKAKTKEEKAANIVFTLNRFVLVEKHKNPIYETLTDKVERILTLWKQRTKDYEKIYKEGTETIQQLNQLQARQKTLNFNNLRYSILLGLEQKFTQDPLLVNDVETLSKQIEQHMFPRWYQQKTARKNIEREVRRFLRRYIKRYNIKLSDLEELYQKVMDSVKNYAQKR
ncbi:MAG: HsdR family type I site-specific deoxyribonuclease [Candidatus Bathyarchaeota archaeon]|nr:MAG: HsdR family type I site-specific deoxyribonuclease [Candidatus Bathyarchaeota archaeon]